VHDTGTGHDVRVEVVVRLADRGSAAELTRLHRAAAHTGFAHIFPPDAPPPTYEEDLAGWEFWLGPDWEQGRRAHVAVAGREAIGVVLTGPDPDEPALGHLSRLYVHPAWWGRGAGTRLYVAALGDLTQRGLPEATLWVLEGNRVARRWYERLGWKPTGRRKTTYAPAGIEDVQYRLALRPGGGR
jgi:ribosomal protein S18 acetylase RimI-like enzyme